MLFSTSIRAGNEPECGWTSPLPSFETTTYSQKFVIPILVRLHWIAIVPHVSPPYYHICLTGLCCCMVLNVDVVLVLNVTCAWNPRNCKSEGLYSHLCVSHCAPALFFRVREVFSSDLNLEAGSSKWLPWLHSKPWARSRVSSPNWATIASSQIISLHFYIRIQTLDTVTCSLIYWLILKVKFVSLTLFLLLRF
jgi:hypothetical protein